MKPEKKSSGFSNRIRETYRNPVSSLELAATGVTSSSGLCGQSLAADVIPKDIAYLRSD